MRRKVGGSGLYRLDEWLDLTKILKGQDEIFTIAKISESFALNANA